MVHGVYIIAPCPMADELRRERDLGTVPSGVFLRHVGTRGRISEWNGRAALQLDWLFLIVFTTWPPICLYYGNIYLISS